MRSGSTLPWSHRRSVRGVPWFGLYQGTPLTERRWDHGNVLPDRITIYQGPIEDVSESEDDVVTEVGETLIHEVGHFFGLSEEEIEEIEDRYWHRRNRRLGLADSETGSDPFSVLSLIHI